MIDFLIREYGFRKFSRSIKDRDIDFDKFDCFIEIYPHYFLYYSDNYKHFTLTMFFDKSRGLPGGGLKDREYVMIPVLIESEEDAVNLLLGFKIQPVKEIREA